MTVPMILASGSAIRTQMLTQAVVAHEVQVARVDEEMITASLLAEGAPPRDVADALAEIGVPSDVSCANFVLARFASEDEAMAVNAHLNTQGLLVRPVGSYKLPHCLRITVGDEASCRHVVAAVRIFKNGS